jgi:hypothetical protein
MSMGILFGFAGIRAMRSKRQYATTAASDC